MTPVIGAALLAATLSACPPLPALPDSYDKLIDLESRLRALATSSNRRCRPAESLLLGTTLLAQGRPEEAIEPLFYACQHGPALRGRGYLALAEAQAFTGEAFRSLGSLAMAQRTLPDSGPDRERCDDYATLLARQYLRRGGTAWGAYHYDADFFIQTKPLVGSLRGITVAGGTLLLYGKSGVHHFKNDGAGTARAIEAVGAATDPRGNTWFVLPDAVIMHPSGKRISLARTPNGRPRPEALAVGLREELFVLTDGRVEHFDGTGTHLTTITAVVGAIDIGTDRAGRLHALLRKANGLTTYHPYLGSSTTLPAAGQGWAWKQADAIAVDPMGGTYVLARKPGAIYSFDANGEFVGRIDSPAEGRGLLRKARGIAVDDSGRLYVITRKRAVVRYR